MKIGHWSFDKSSRELTRGGVTRRLTPKAAGVLAALAETPGQVWSRDAIFERVWPCVIVCDEVLTHAIAELRRALGDTASKPAYIETVHKSGYRLRAAVERVEGAAKTGGAGFDVDAYAEYLSARELFEARGRTRLHAAIDTLDRAESKLADFAPAHALRALIDCFASLYYDLDGDHLLRAQEAAAAALRLDRHCPEANIAAGFVHFLKNDDEAGFQGFAKAIAVDLRSIEAHMLLGRALFAQGRHDKAALMLRRATQLQSENYHLHVLAAKALYGAGDAVAAQSHIRTANVLLDLHADFSVSSKAIADKIYCLLTLGDQRAAEDLMERHDVRGDGEFYYIGCGLARAGENDAALDCLEACVEAGWAHRGWLDNDPDLDPLRDAPRFREIERSLPRYGC